MSPDGRTRRPPVAGRARGQLRRGSERAGARIARGLGEPALFAILLSAVVSSLFMVLGVVAGDALGLTPLAFLAAGVVFVLTIATYVEGSSVHIERGGASNFARYAFNELWSFVAGWAILLDYLIVMAIGAVAISDYLAVFWGELDARGPEIAIAGLALVYVATQNVRGLGPRRLGMVLRLSLFGIVLLAVVAGIAFAQEWDPDAIVDSVDLGTTPEIDELVFASVVAGVALIGVEAASGLAGEVRVGRRGLRRVVLVSAGAALLLYVGVSAAALMAVPVVDGQTALGERYIGAPVVGIVSTFEPDWLMDVARCDRGRDRRRAADRGDEQHDARPGPALLLARHQPPDPERRRAPPRHSRHAPCRDRPCGRDRVPARRPARPRVPGRDLRLRRADQLRDRPPVGGRAALPRAGPAERVPRAALDPRRPRQRPAAGRASARSRR